MVNIGITQGDYNGISYEIILKSFLDKRIFEFITPIIYGSTKILNLYKNKLNLQKIQVNKINKPSEAKKNIINIIDCVECDGKVEIGKSTKQAGKAAMFSLNRAVSDIKNKMIDTIVTAPINKKNINSSSFNFPGHTEFFTSKFDAKESIMLMTSEMLKVAVLTGHVPLKDVSNLITEELILSKLRTLNKSLKTDFNLQKPKIAIFGINPHTGDEGLFGKDEQKVIIPAIEKAKEEGMYVFGPYPADGFFGSGNFKKFDAALATYHDQGLIPFKAITIDEGVNFTAGLSIIRTSPAHGTGYDIAGKNIASPKSLINAMFLSAEIFKNRR